MRPRGHLRKTRHCHAAACSPLSSAPLVIASMSFAVAFGFLSGATAPGAHYDPYMFAIGVAALFGAACGAIGILISRIRQMKTELRDLETRLDEAADRNWEISEAQERTKSFFEAQGDVIVRRDAQRRHHLRQRRVLRACRPRARRPAWRPPLRCRCWSRAKPHVARRRHAHLRPENRDARRARAGSPGAKSSVRADAAQRDAERRPRRDRPRAGRARARRGARPGRSGQPRQIALPGDGVARDPHAAERHSRHGRPHRRHAADARADDLSARR